MLQHIKSFHHTKKILISLLAISLASCSTGSETSSPTDVTISPSVSSPISSSPQATASPVSVAIPGIKDIGEINFKTPVKNSPTGFFDAVNDSNAAKVEISKATPITLRGWAFLPDKGKVADSVIITSGNNNSLIAVAPVNMVRPDVVQVLKNPAYRNSGWRITLDPSTLPSDRVVLKAWAFNSATKEATQLTPTHEVVVLN